MALLTPYWGLDGLLIFSPVIMALYLYATRNFKHWQKKGIVELTPTPFFGNFAECVFQQKSAAEFLQELYKSQAEPYVGFYIFDRPFILLRDPLIIKHVLVKDFNLFPNRHNSPDDVHDRLGYANLFSMKEPAWRNLRTKLSPLFSSGKIKKMFKAMLDVIGDLETHLDSLKLEGNGKIIDLKELAARLTTDMIASNALGLRANSLNQSDAEFRKHGRKIFTSSMKRSIDLLMIFFVPNMVKKIRAKFFGREASQFLRTAFWQAINDRLATGAKRNDLIDTLIELRETYGTEDLGGYKFDGDDLVSQAAVFFAAGFESSSALLSFTLYQLALNPDIQDRVRNEIHDALDKAGGEMTYEMLTDLRYLDMVISEILRMYPPLPFLDRVSEQDYKLPNSDVVLEKGTPIYISVFGLHNDPKYFPNPEKFDPERFNEENRQNTSSCAYYPFGDGPRICIGRRLGLLQGKMGITHILRNYEVTPCEQTAIPMVLNTKTVTTTALTGVYLNIRKVEKTLI